MLGHRVAPYAAGALASSDRQSARATAALGAAILVAALACKSGTGQPAPRPAAVAPGTPTAAPVSQHIDAHGGRFATADGRLVVTVQPGTVAGTDFTAQPITNTALGGVGSAYRLGPAGARFPRPVTLTFVVGATSPALETLTVAYQDERGYWVHATDVTRNLVARTVSAAATHFSDWTLTSADPAQDMAGSFTITSRLDVPAFIDTQSFTANGTAALTFVGQSSSPGVLDRSYVFSPALTLQPPTAGGAACTIADPAPFTETNAAEALNNPDRFFWGTGASWHVACGAQTALLDALFDTEGVNRLGCARTPGSQTVSADNIQGSYAIDCSSQQRGTISAVWSFQRCGGPCTSANPCRTADFSCATGTAVCTDDGNLANGVSCGTNQVCNTGTCVACTAGAACTPADPCHTGTTSCATGASVCVDTGIAPPGTTCGTNQVCDISGGACITCASGTACQPANVCHDGIVTCSTGTPVCTDAGTNVANGMSCGTNLVCNAGSCTSCTADLSCTPENPCHTGTTSCTTGSQTCVDTTNNAQDGTSCGTSAAPAFCSAGVCQSCAPSSCVPTNPCHNGQTSCPPGTCTDLGTNAAAGSSCGPDQVCDGGGTCVQCIASVACTPAASPCHVGTTSCSTGAQTCSDTGTPLGTGTSCGSGQVCDATGACVACQQGAVCTLQNACIATAAIDCTAGAPVCTATSSVPDATSNASCPAPTNACSSGSCLPTPCTAGACVPANPCHTGSVACGPPDTCTDSGTAMPDGSSCGTNLVCGSGSCLACPGAEGLACQSTNPCATAAKVSCGSGIPVCTDATFVPDGTACGTALTCQAGVCR